MILKIEKQKEYELLDSGDGYKLERYGSYVISRPDPESLWHKLLTKDVWDKAELKFIRNGEHTKWIIKENTQKSWDISFHNLIFTIKPTSFKHIGLFPEHIINWQWMEDIIKKNKQRPAINILNLFAYTGGATLSCARAGAEVCHVDGSKTAVAWARKNVELSGLKNAPIRWIVDDVIVFIKREIKRGRKYDAVIMDPPSFGHGPKDELWKIEENFLELMDLCKQILSKDPLFMLINGYTAGYSPIAYENNLKDIMKEYSGIIESGELAIKESKSDRLLPCGIFARWSKN
jgi:23S rRNA (cytosine1962-C5)-methyltransferase